MNDVSSHDFWIVWLSLAARSLVDEAGGAEYLRVLGEWNQAGRPEWTAEEIVARANRGPATT